MSELTFHGVNFELDLSAIREAITRRELEDGLTLGRVAAGAGISRMSLWRILGGQQPSLATLGRLLKYLALDRSAVLKSDSRPAGSQQAPAPPVTTGGVTR